MGKLSHNLWIPWCLGVVFGLFAGCNDEQGEEKKVGQTSRSEPAATPQVTEPLAMPLEQQSARVVEGLLSLQHGLEFLSPEDKRLLELIQLNPDPYIKVLKEMYAGRNILLLEEPEDVLRFERAMSLLGAMGSREALAQLAKWYLILESATKGGRETANWDQVVLHQSMVLVALGDSRQDDLITHILNTLPAMDSSARIGALEYLGRSTQGDRRVIQALRDLMEKEESPLYHDLYLQRAVDVISARK